jgi:transposase
MRRTEALQGVRVIKFRDVLGRYEASEFTQTEAAELLGVSERTFRRWSQRFEEGGEAGLSDRRLGKASGKRVPADRADEVEALYRARYSGFTAWHFHEHLVREHKFNWGYTWTKAFLQSKGLLVRAKTRGAHRRKRPRRPLPGMMLHHREAIRRRQARRRRARRLAPRMAGGPRRAGPDRDDGRRDQRDLFGVPGARGGHGLDIPRPVGGVFRPRAGIESLY